MISNYTITFSGGASDHTLDATHAISGGGRITNSKTGGWYALLPCAPRSAPGPDSMRPLLCLFALLTGCAGHEAMVWKQPQQQERSSSYCEVRAGDKLCTSMPESEVQRILRDVQRQPGQM